MQDRVSGFTVEGTWAEIVEHGERMMAALRAVECPSEYLEEWDDWRPKPIEQLDDIREKTAQHARLEKGPGEYAGQSPTDDVRNAGEELAAAYDRLTIHDDAVEKWLESVQYLGRAADSTSRQAIRNFEDTVYRRLMTKFSPFYFDNKLISANLQQSRDGERYALEVNVNDDELKDAVRGRLEELEQDVDRWRLEVETDTKTVETAEGIEYSGI